MIHEAAKSTGLFLLFLLFSGSGLSFGQTLRFQDGLTYSTFYSASVNLKDGSRIRLFDLASFEGDGSPWPNQSEDFGDRPISDPPEDTKYFLWIRRGGASGTLTYPLSFRRINEIEFLGPYGGDNPQAVQQVEMDINGNKQVASIVNNGAEFTGWFGLPGAQAPQFSEAVITLVDGRQQEVWVKTDGYLGGIDEESGTYAMLWLAQDSINNITFDHDGRYARCPKDGAIFYAADYDICPFDGTKLVVSEPQVGPQVQPRPEPQPQVQPEPADQVPSEVQSSSETQAQPES